MSSQASDILAGYIYVKREKQEWYESEGWETVADDGPTPEGYVRMEMGGDIY